MNDIVNSAESQAQQAVPAVLDAEGREVDFAAASHFLSRLSEDTDQFWFRTFNDDANSTDRSGSNYFGTLDDLGSTLAQENAAGRGVFVTINAGGKKGVDITTARAVFFDSDGAAIEPLLQSLPEPHYVIESSPGNFHIYWFIEPGLTHLEFRSIQKGLATRFDGDASINDPARVMRLVGFYHQKDKRAPFRTRVVTDSAHQPYSLDFIREKFPRGDAAPSSIGNEPLSAQRIQKNRNNAVTSIVGKLRYDGFTQPAALAAALEENAQRCDPPLDGAEVRNIVSGIYQRYQPNRDIMADNDFSIGGDFAKTIGEVKAELNGEALKARALDTGGRMFGFVDTAEMLKPKPVSWLIDGLIEGDTSTGLFGDYGTCKSFIALDMAACIATGTPFAGRPIRRPGAVFYLLGEGGGGMGRRLCAWQMHSGLDVSNAPLHFSTRAIHLDQPGGLATVTSAVEEKIAETGRMPTFIVVDTKSRHTGLEENSNDDGATFVEAMDALRLRFNCNVMFVHHSGTSEDSKGRMRGASSVPAGVDHIYQVVRKDDIVTLKVRKMKDGREPDDQAFKLTEIELSAEWTEPGSPTTTSAVLTACSGGRDENQCTTVQQEALDAIGLMIDPSGRVNRRHVSSGLMAQGILMDRRDRSRVLGQLVKRGSLKIDGDDYLLASAVPFDKTDLSFAA